MYLSNKETVDNFTENKNDSIIMNGKTVEARRYITPSERLVLSNVCPMIPNKIPTKELEKHVLKLLHPMAFLRTSPSVPEYSHIYSFRRQVFINLEPRSIPDCLVVNFDDTSYRIFLPKDNLICFSYKKQGHTAAHCKTTPPISPDSTSSKHL
ncbi:hypothetical protein JTB14_013842 [Gonioctena quinquepunctata]|nr:hypothetical protein JTB14_013842 [Gonioctena quinquepunctata]